MAGGWAVTPDIVPIRLPAVAAPPSGPVQPDVPRAANLPAASRDQPGRSAAFPLVVLVSSVGTAMVAVAYAAGRAGWPYLGALYWPGELLAFVPIALRAYSSGLTARAEGFGLVLLLALQQFLLFRMYSPIELKFPDELQHWRGTVNLIHSGTLNQPNYSLPVALHYPGLEALGGAVSASTGLSVTATAFVVTAVLRLLLVCALYAICRRIYTDWRLAVLAGMIYAANPHYLFFDAMYIYQSLAMPYLLLTAWAILLWRSSHTTAGGWVILLTAIGVVTISHHVTSFVMVALLGGLAAAAAFRRRAERDLRPAAAWLIATAAVLAWVLLVARDLGGYLSPVLGQLRGNLIELVHGQLGATMPGAAPLVTPLGERLVTIGSLGLLAALVVRGSLDLWRDRRAEPWTVPLIGGALLIFVTGALRLVALNGAELSGRAATFVYVPVALVAAAALRGLRRKRRGLLGGAGQILAAVVIVAGGVASGWPPIWDRLPGPYLVSGFERSVDPQGVAAARWTLASLGPAHRWAGDFTAYNLLATIGDQDTVRTVAPLFDGRGADPAARSLVEYQGIEFLAVDLRDSMQLPASGSYFAADPNAERYRAPLPRSALRAVDAVPGVSRIYDSGDIRLYDLRGSAYER
jgi:hypothetical protein